MQRIQENDKRIKMHMDNVKIQKRIHKLMQLQQQLEEMEPIPYTPHKPRNYQFAHTRNDRIGSQYIEELRPMSTASYTHPIYCARFKHSLSDFEPYTPAHADSDNGDIIAKNYSKSVDNIHRNRAVHQELNPAVRETNRESAMYKLCKGLLEVRNKSTKY
ncbi:uncharacterized protein LOC115764331 [Drosophila novamexicana]|uniref:uncharacterized protein LOC115764331 n=1 Tax=Drosophila novamexicana TaxID=47314 RepID=UPI0011E5E189|nr:uncharacterized protein LOC115764331 [Drosophila novamexicana]